MTKDDDRRDHIVSGVALVLSGAIVVWLGMFARLIAERYDSDEAVIDAGRRDLSRPVSLVGILVVATGLLYLALEIRKRRGRRQ